MTSLLRLVRKSSETEMGGGFDLRLDMIDFGAHILLTKANSPA